MNLELTSRRNVLRVGAVAAFGVLSQTSPARAQQTPPPERKGPKPMDLDLVQYFVGACHRDLDTVKSILKREPGVVNASFNRGGGDWERGMEAAAHMGRPDIADVLIAHKARKCIFWAAMAGEESIVRAFVSADPETVNTGGAHNISLMAHAAICGKISLTQFLQDNGARVDNKSLEHAVRGNRIQMVEWLVESGANPGAKDIFGNFHYDTAEKRGFSEIASFLKARAGV
ncbi:MAG: ankyrin repeat domain-containing protein [Verrucomicrobiae bacterium]|nr:ankyrin repeat domain-containing protein [Verrucomicrobiae bacterium]